MIGRARLLLLLLLVGCGERDFEAEVDALLEDGKCPHSEICVDFAITCGIGETLCWDAAASCAVQASIRDSFCRIDRPECFADCYEPGYRCAGSAATLIQEVDCERAALACKVDCESQP